MSFKPYYKWNTFNTKIIGFSINERCPYSFKPYYKWNTFNTEELQRLSKIEFDVLNLIINGIPSILKRVACSSSCW